MKIFKHVPNFTKVLENQLRPLYLYEENGDILPQLTISLVF